MDPQSRKDMVFSPQKSYEKLSCLKTSKWLTLKKQWCQRQLKHAKDSRFQQLWHVSIVFSNQTHHEPHVLDAKTLLIALISTSLRILLDLLFRLQAGVLSSSTCAVIQAVLMSFYWWKHHRIFNIGCSQVHNVEESIVKTAPLSFHQRSFQIFRRFFQ